MLAGGKSRIFGTPSSIAAAVGGRAYAPIVLLGNKSFVRAPNYLSVLNVGLVLSTANMRQLPSLFLCTCAASTSFSSDRVIH